MATIENNYTEDTALKKQQKKVPDPTQGGTDVQGVKEVPLKSGAVPPAKDVPTENGTQPQATDVQQGTTPPVNNGVANANAVQANNAIVQQNQVDDPQRPGYRAPGYEGWSDSRYKEFGPGGEWDKWKASLERKQLQQGSVPTTPQDLTAMAPAPQFVPPKVGQPVEDDTQNTAVNQGETQTNVKNDATQGDTNVKENENIIEDNTPQNGGTVSTGSAPTEDLPLYKTDPAVEQAYADEIRSWGLNGNVDMMRLPPGSNFYELMFTEDANGVYKSEDGKNYAHNLFITPVLKDGTVWDADRVQGYFNALCKQSKELEAKGIYMSPLEIDAQVEGLIVGTDTPVDFLDKVQQAQQKYVYGTPEQQLAWGKAESTANMPIPEFNLGENTIQNPYGGSTIDNLQLGGQGGETNPYAAPKNEVEGTGAKNDAQDTKSAENEGNNNQLSTDVKNPTPKNNVEDWKKDYQNSTKSELETALDDKKKQADADPNEIKALEELYADKANELTDEEKAAKAQALQDLKTQYAGSNRDLEKLPVVSRDKMVQAGWVGAKGDQIFYPQVVTIKDGKGKNHKVLMTPIMSNGAVMTQDAFKKYVEDLDGADDIGLTDQTGNNLIIRMDTSDGDLDALDKLLEDIIKGEKPSSMTLEEREAVAKKEDPNVKTKEAEIKAAQEELAKAREMLTDPTKSPKNIYVEQAEKRIKEFDEETDAIKKRHKRSRLIAGIGDLLQSVLNSVGAWYGADSAELTSMAANAANASEEELTRRDKKRKELEDSRDKALTKLGTDLTKDVEYWQKHLDDLNKALDKYNMDTSKLYTSSSLRREEKEMETLEQGRRRVAEAKAARERIKYQGEVQKGVIQERGRVADVVNKNKAGYQKGVNAAKAAGDQATARVKEHERRVTKSTPSWHDLHPNSKGTRKGNGSHGGGGNKTKAKTKPKAKKAKLSNGWP